MTDIATHGMAKEPVQTYVERIISLQCLKKAHQLPRVLSLTEQILPTMSHQQHSCTSFIVKHIEAFTCAISLLHLSNIKQRDTMKSRLSPQKCVQNQTRYFNGSERKDRSAGVLMSDSHTEVKDTDVSEAQNPCLYLIVSHRFYQKQDWEKKKKKKKRPLRCNKQN